MQLRQKRSCGFVEARHTRLFCAGSGFRRFGNREEVTGKIRCVESYRGAAALIQSAIPRF